jgi:PhzF family phenazine biosynthesis protein
LRTRYDCFGCGSCSETWRWHFSLVLNNARITVQGEQKGTILAAALQSPATHSEPATPELIADVLDLFSLVKEDLDARIPPAIANAGAKHVVIALSTRDLLSSMRYDLVARRRLMLENGLVTITLAYGETPQLFHVRNPFASGGVYEDPATGAAAAALGGYLRDCNWPHAGHIDIMQGDDMGIPSRIRAEISSTPGESIRVSGLARIMQ